MGHIDIATCIEQAKSHLDDQTADDDRHWFFVQHWMAGVYGEHPPHENAWHQALCVWRMIRAREQVSESGDISAYVGVAILSAIQITELHVSELGEPSLNLVSLANGFLEVCQAVDSVDPVYFGVRLEGFVQGCFNSSVEADAGAGFRVRAGARKGRGAASRGPSDQELYAAFVEERPNQKSDRATHLAVAKRFGLPMPPSDAGRRRVSRAVKKLRPKK
jgi:hypothetical protein